VTRKSDENVTQKLGWLGSTDRKVSFLKKMEDSRPELGKERCPMGYP